MRNGGDLQIYNADNSGLVTLYCDTSGQLNISSKLYCPGVTVQTVYLRYDTKSQWNYTGVGDVIISDLNTTITPRSTSSKIKITYCITYETYHETTFRLYRNIGGAGDTLIGLNVNDTNYWSGVWITGYDVDNASTPRTATLIYLDSPNTTSAVTYKLSCQSSYTSSFIMINRSINSAGQAQYEVGITQVFLEELAQ
jgi:hypothetical protein